MASLHILSLMLLTTVSYHGSLFICSLKMDSGQDGVVNDIKTNNVLTHNGRRIIGGSFVDNIEQFPYMAYLHRVTKVPVNATHIRKSQDTCGASILTNKYALSAAHCFRGCGCREDIDDDMCSSCKVGKPNEFTLYAGSTVASNATSITPIKQFYVHPEHKFVDISNNCIHRYDVAVIELATPLEFSKKISPVRLPDLPSLGMENFKMDIITSNDPKSYCQIMGWGWTSLNDRTRLLTEIMKVASVPIIDMKECISQVAISRGFTPGTIMKNVCPDTDFCTKSPNEDTGICHGDSGGPVICGGVQVGISSWSVAGCVGHNIPSVFSRVDINMRWIMDIIK